MKYIALLRGINVGGNNKVSMAQLKDSFMSLGFKNVITYINSGNIIFDTNRTDSVKLVEACEAVIKKDFGFPVICSIISADDLHKAVANAPAWWDKQDDDKHNAIFVIPPATSKEIMDQVGEAKPEYEKVDSYGSVIFWTAPVKTFGRTRYSTIVGTAAYKSITIRNANTVRKLVALSGV